MNYGFPDTSPYPLSLRSLPPMAWYYLCLLRNGRSKIFIGGLSFETTDEALKRYFEQFGPVADAIVMKDVVSRRSRGFGFITYMNAASVDAALSVEQHILDNRRVEAKRAVPRSEVPSKVGRPSIFNSPLSELREGLLHP